MGSVIVALQRQRLRVPSQRDLQGRFAVIRYLTLGLEYIMYVKGVKNERAKEKKGRR